MPVVAVGVDSDVARVPAECVHGAPAGRVLASVRGIPTSSTIAVLPVVWTHHWHHDDDSIYYIVNTTT